MQVSDKVYVIHYKQIAHKSQIAKAQQEIVSVSLFLTQSAKPTEKSTTLTQKTFQTSYQQETHPPTFQVFTSQALEWCHFKLPEKLCGLLLSLWFTFSRKWHRFHVTLADTSKTCQSLLQNDHPNEICICLWVINDTLCTPWNIQYFKI